MKSKKPALSKLFKGKDTYGEELKEAKAIKSGKISPQQYAKGEKMEESKKTKKMAKGGPAAGKFGPAVMAQLQSKLANRPGAGPTPPVAPRVPVSPNNAQAVAANIAANQQAAQANRAAQASRFQQMAANTPRPAPVTPAAPAGMKKGGCAKKAKGGCTKMAKGGGVESRGKTKGRFI